MILPSISGGQSLGKPLPDLLRQGQSLCEGPFSVPCRKSKPFKPSDAVGFDEKSQKIRVRQGERIRSCVFQMTDSQSTKESRSEVKRSLLLLPIPDLAQQAHFVLNGARGSTFVYQIPIIKKTFVSYAQIEPWNSNMLWIKILTFEMWYRPSIAGTYDSATRHGNYRSDVSIVKVFLRNNHLSMLFGLVHGRIFHRYYFTRTVELSDELEITAKFPQLFLVGGTSVNHFPFPVENPLENRHVVSVLGIILIEQGCDNTCINYTTHYRISRSAISSLIKKSL